MNLDRAREWVKALRSGDYPQVQGRLSDGVGYCCLGVACEVAIANGVDLTKVEERGREGRVSIAYNGNPSSLPLAVSEWLETPKCTCGHDKCDLREDNLSVVFEGNEVSLIAMNDGMNCTFEQIADAIEAKYLNA